MNLPGPNSVRHACKMLFLYNSTAPVDRMVEHLTSIQKALDSNPSSMVQKPLYLDNCTCVFL